MWVLCFLLAVPVCDAAAVGKLSSQDENVKEYPTYRIGVENTQAEMEKISKQFLEDLIDARLPRGSRQKRAMRDIKTSLSDKTGVFSLRRIKAFSEVCSRPTNIAFADFGNSNYAVCLSTPTTDIPSTVNIVEVTTRGTMPLDSWVTNNPSKAVSFSDGQQLYILVADSENKDGTDLVKFNFTTYKSRYYYTVQGQYPTAIALWEMKSDGGYHLAIANSNGNKDSSDLTTEIFTYTWKGTYFDQYSTAITAYDVKDIEPFHIHNVAYLAVANHRRGKGNYHVDSEIFKYNLDPQKWVSLQKIRTYGAMDWEFFSLGSGTGKEFFLAVANHVEQGNHDINSVIYKFVKDKFVPFQCLLTSGATSIAALSTESTFLLAIANEYEAVHIYQYDGWRFVPASVQYTQSTMSSGVTSVSFHKIKDYEGNKLVLAVSNPRKDGPALYELEFEQENPLGGWHSDSTKWCMNILDEIEESAADKTMIDMNNVIFTDQGQNVVIEGNLNFQNGFDASILTAPKVIDVKKGVTYDNSILLKLRNLKHRLQVVERRLMKAQETLRRAVSLNGYQTLTGTYNFKNSAFSCVGQLCHFDKIDTTFLNSENISDLKNNVVFINEETFIESLRIEKIKAQDLKVHGFLDEVDVSNIVKKSGSHHISGTKTFYNSMKSEEISVAGLVDGEKVTRYTVFTNGGFQNVTGNLTFQHIETSSLEVTGNVNNVDLSHFYKNVVLSDKSYIIGGKKTFFDVVVKDLNVKSINGVDMSHLWNNVMWRHKPQVITAPMTFTSVTAKNDILVSGYVNGLKIPGPRVLQINSSAVIQKEKRFTTATEISKLIVTGSINGIRILDVSGENHLDILLTDGTQVITGQKTFREIFLDNHSYVSGTVNEVDLSELQKTALRKNESLSSDTLIFKNLEVKGPLTVHGLIADENLSDIYAKAVKLDDATMPSFESVTFQEGMTVGDLQSDTVNGLDLAKQLVLTKDPESVKGHHQIVKGFKTFHDVNMEADSDVLGLVNKIDISFLQESIIKLGNQVITTPLTIEGNLKVKNLTVKGTVNEIETAELVTLSGEETITGEKTFYSIKAEDLDVQILKVKGLINEIDIGTEVENTMTYNGQQTVTGIKSVTGKLLLSEDTNFNVDLLNNIDISSVWEDSVRVDIPQNIAGNKVFLDEVSFSKFWFHQSLDGVTEWDLKHNWMYQDLNQEIFGDVILANGAEVSDLNLLGYINSINITDLTNKIVKANEPAVISGPVIFENRVVSYGNITLTGKIQNVDLSEAVMKSKHNVITAEKEFLSNVTVIGDLTVSGDIDEISAKDFCENSVSLRENVRIGDLTVKGNLVFEDGVKIAGLLAGVEIDMLHDLSTGSNEESVITDLKTFENLTIMGPVTLYGRVNGVDIKVLNDTYMSLSREQEIPASLYFDKINVPGTISASNVYTHDNKVNGIDIVKLRKSVLRTSETQIVENTYRFDKVTFADDVIVVGRVNAIEVPKGLMRPNRANYVYNSKIFKQNLAILGDLLMEDGKTVHSTDVSEWEKQSVLKDGGKYVVDGHKVFKNIATNDVRIHGTINGVKISEDNLLMVYGPQSCEGKEVMGDVTFLRNVTVQGFINGKDLSDLVRRVARKDGNNKFSGVKYFSQPGTINTLSTELINGVDTLKLNKTIHTKLNFDVLSNRMKELKETVVELQETFDNQAVVFQCYEYFQGFGIPGSYLWLYVAAPDTKELLLLSDISLKSDCSSIKIFSFDGEAQQFEPKQQGLLASYAVSMKTTFVWGSTYLFVANRMPSRKCQSVDSQYQTVSGNGTVPGHIFIWNKENGKFSLYQTIMMEPTTDVEVFSDNDMLCAVYTEVPETKVYCANEKQKEFRWRETLTTSFGRKMALLEDDSDWPLIRLAVAGTDTSDYINYVDIYNWKRESVFGPPVQRIAASNVHSVMFMLHRNTYSVFFVIAEGTITEIGNDPRILIYKLDEKENMFQKYQEIKDSGYLDWMTLPTGDIIFFVLNNRGNINIYHYRYSSGFVREDTLHGTGSKTLHAFERVDPEDSNHYLALAGPQSILPHEPEGTDFAKILKSNIKGKRLLY